MAQQMFTKIDRQMLTKIGQQMFLKIGQQLFHTIETDGRQAGANQQMFLTYTIETADEHTIDGRRPFVTPGRFFCLLFNWQSYHYLHSIHMFSTFFYKYPRLQSSYMNIVKLCMYKNTTYTYRLY